MFIELIILHIPTVPRMSTLHILQPSRKLKSITIVAFSQSLARLYFFLAAAALGDAPLFLRLSALAFSEGTCTSQTSPADCRAQISHQVGSSSHHSRPWRAEVGNMWWLQCQPSPKARRDTQALLVDMSPAARGGWKVALRKKGREEHAVGV